MHIKVHLAISRQCDRDRSGGLQFWQIPLNLITDAPSECMCYEEVMRELHYVL